MPLSLPHFEKMLYDNAQLAATYARAYSLTASPDYRRVAEDTIAYVLRDLGHPEGGFYSAEDADSPPPENPGADSAEGVFYVWTHEEITQRLPPNEAAAIISHYGVVISTPDTRAGLSRHLPAAEHMQPIAGKAAAFVCIGTNCLAPENRPEAVVRLLTEKHRSR